MHFLVSRGASTADPLLYDEFNRRWVAWVGAASLLSWGRGIGSATGLYFLEPLIFANIPAFVWLGYTGLFIARAARAQTPPWSYASHG